jgi:hypothetical protein
MPTNLLRKSNTPRPDPPPKRASKSAARQILIRAGSVVIRARLLNTPTAERIWQTLPLYSTAETWGQLIHFETHAESGREPKPVRRVKPGQIAYWAEEDRIVIGFGETPLSKPGEIFLPAPASLWAEALDDVTKLKSVRPGERVAVLQSDS